MELRVETHALDNVPSSKVSVGQQHVLCANPLTSISRRTTSVATVVPTDEATRLRTDENLREGIR